MSVSIQSILSHHTSVMSSTLHLNMSSTLQNKESIMLSEESEDEWIDTDDVEKPSAVHDKPIPLKNKIPEYPGMTFAQVSQLPAKTSLQNFASEPCHTLYRDEPYVDKKYPGLRLSPQMSSYKHLYIRQVLYYPNSKFVRVRVPDIKSKTVEIQREVNGIFVLTKSVPNNTIFFKKKCIDKKSGTDTAFELGVNYTSHTSGLPSQFVFVVVPFVDGKFLMNLAERSEKFYVKSKRQERFLPHSKKKHKKNVEHLKIATDIQAAQETLAILQQQLHELHHDNDEYSKIVAGVKAVLPLMSSGAVQIGLAHGTRSTNNITTVSM